MSAALSAMAMTAAFGFVGIVIMNGQVEGVDLLCSRSRRTLELRASGAVGLGLN